MTGRSPKGSGSRPSGRAAKGVSPVPASIPSACLFAWTSVGDYRCFPQYINVSRKNGSLVITVRSIEDTSGEYPTTGALASMALPDDQISELIKALEDSL